MSRPYKKPALALDTNLVQDNTPQEIVPGIFIGSIHSAFNQDALMKNNISHILNASRIPATFPKHFTYLSIDIRDKDESNLLACIPASNIFIEAGIDAGGVLVHCFGGRSRSAALVAAFLMSSRNLNLNDALKIIVTARPVVCINKGFDRQLSAYFSTRYDVYAAQQVLLHNRVASLRHIRKALVKKSPSAEPNHTSCQGEELNQASSSHSGLLKRDRRAGNLDDSMDLDDDNDNESYRGLRNEQTGEAKGETKSSTVSVASVEGAVVTTPRLARTRSGNVLEESMFPLPKSEGTAPNCRLSRPGSNSVRVIPPLRGLERRYDCVGCGFSLFALSNVLREDLDLSEAIEATRSLSTNALTTTGDDLEEEESKHTTCSAVKSLRDPPDLMSASRSADSISNLSQKGYGACEKESTARADDKMEDMDIDFTSPRAVVVPSTGRHAQAKGFFGEFEGADDVNEVSGARDNVNIAQQSTPPLGDVTKRSLRLPIEQVTRGTMAPNSARGSFSSSNGSVNSLRERPQSAEKRRWLARVSLLKADAKESISRPPLVPDDKAAKLAADDDLVVEHMQAGRSKHLFLEYLGWMGRDPLVGESDGLLQCPNCRKVLGSWSWGRDDRGVESSFHDLSAATHLDPPLFAILRETVQLAYMPLDQTPNATPRPSESNNSNNSTPRSARDSVSSTDTSPRPLGSSRPGSGAGRPRSGSMSSAPRARVGVDQIMLSRPSSGSRPSTGASPRDR